MSQCASILVVAELGAGIHFFPESDPPSLANVAPSGCSRRRWGRAASFSGGATPRSGRPVQTKMKSALVMSVASAMPSSTTMLPPPKSIVVSKPSSVMVMSDASLKP